MAPSGTVVSSSGDGGNDESLSMLDGSTSPSLQSFLEILEQDATNGKLSVGTVRPIIMKILSDPTIYCGFDQVKAVCSSVLAPPSTNSSSGNSGNEIGNTLDLFSFGTLKQYTDSMNDNNNGDVETSYMGLNDQAMSKLAQLTVLSCIQDASSQGLMSVTYTSLADALGWNEPDPNNDNNNNNSIESRVVDVLIQCVYADVLRGTLCQKTKTFGWSGQPLPVVCSRDVSPDRIPDLLGVLRGLQERLTTGITDLKSNESTVMKKLEDDAMYWKSVQERTAAAKKEGTSNKSAFSMDIGGGGPHGGRGYGDMFGDFRGGRHGGNHRSSKRSRAAAASTGAFRM